MTDPALEAILTGERLLHPHLDERDLFKLVSQAVFGGDHLLRDRMMFEKGLATEWYSLGEAEGPHHPPLQVIDPEGRTARVHLVPLRNRGIDLRDLAEFLAGQPLKNGRRGDFQRVWKRVPEITGAWEPSMDQGLLSSMEPGSTPARHSPGYGFAAYRICNDILSPRSAEWLGGRGILP